MTPDPSQTDAGPLAGLKVIDIATVLGAPVAATLLAEFGADVIKVEEPTTGDLLRQFGQSIDGVPLGWVQEARNKKSITLNLRLAEGQDVLKKLLAEADVLVENFRPGTLDKWNLGSAVLRAINPRLVILRISGYGQTGPYRHKGAFDRIASAFAGLTFTTGYPDRPPLRQSFALADFLAASYGAYAVMLALYHRDVRGGPGQEIDLALYEGILRSSEGLVTAFTKLGVTRTRTGNRNPGVVPAGQYRTSDGVWLSIHAGTDALWAKLANMIGGAALNPKWRASRARLAEGDAVETLVENWIATREAAALLAELDRVGVPAERLNTAADIAADPHIRARNLLEWNDPRLGPVTVVDVVPKLSATPGKMRWAGPDKGQHNEEIYGSLGMNRDEIARLKAAGVI
ncbi:MAG: CoA transferase [Alphaproteobacteria bacterium]|nr:CoA transferase [Alphaproteobacteria bacterium]